MLSAQCILPVGGLLHLLQSHYHLIQLWIFRLPQWGGGSSGWYFQVKKMQKHKTFCMWSVEESQRDSDPRHAFRFYFCFILMFTFGCFTHFSWVLGLPIEKVLD